MDTGIDGLDTSKGILALHPGRKAITAIGFYETAHVKEAQELDAGKYIKKPCVPEEMGLVIKKRIREIIFFVLLYKRIYKLKS